MGMVGEDRHGEKGVSTGGRSLGAYDKRQLDCHKRGATSSLLQFGLGNRFTTAGVRRMEASAWSRLDG